MTRQLISEAVSLIHSFEGLRLTAYQDQGGIWTIGWGHTGADVFPGMVITQTAADMLFQHDTQATCNAISELVTVPLTDHQFGALVSLVYNIGIAAFSASTFRRVLNTGDYNGASAQFVVWDKIKINGVFVVSPGLEDRRKKECIFWMTPDAGSQLATTQPTQESLTAVAAKEKPLYRTKTFIGIWLMLGAKGLDYAADLNLIDFSGMINGFSDLSPWVHKVSFGMLILGGVTSAYGRFQLRQMKGI